MTGSAAEERIRSMVVAMMRQRWPQGRIIHELQCGQGERRLDVACVTADRLVLAEIKSENDVIKRAEAQLAKATTVANEVWLCIAEKHEAAIEAARAYWKRPTEEWDEAREAAAFYRGVKLYVERTREEGHDLRPSFKAEESWRDLPVSPHAQFDLLWADEMRGAIGEFFGGGGVPGALVKLTRGDMIRLAVEHMSGRELRRAVCARLRYRHFPRADDPASVQEPAHAA